MLRVKAKISVSIFCVFVTSCSSNAPAPVVDLSYFSSSKSISNKSAINSTALSSKSSRTIVKHLVKPGETLYSIAWRYSVDHRALAKLNEIDDNTIYPGQKLIIAPSSKQVFDSKSLVSAVRKDVFKQTEIKFSSKKHSQSKQLSSKNNNTLQSKARTEQKVERWIWPVNGKIIEKFSNRSNLNKGLDIAAQRGSPVRATAQGRVVYSGNGLRGYGHLVIIKHNETYLSAYAHNDKIHVQENEFVKAGQKIADLGRSDSDRDKLHFEIRYKGKPVDPLKYLPKSEKL